MAGRLRIFKGQFGYIRRGQFFKCAMTVVGLMPGTREMSLTPEPFMVNQ